MTRFLDSISSWIYPPSTKTTRSNGIIVKPELLESILGQLEAVQQQEKQQERAFKLRLDTILEQVLQLEKTYPTPIVPPESSNNKSKRKSSSLNDSTVKHPLDSDEPFIITDDMRKGWQESSEMFQSYFGKLLDGPERRDSDVKLMDLLQLQESEHARKKELEAKIAILESENEELKRQLSASPKSVVSQERIAELTQIIQKEAPKPEPDNETKKPEKMPVNLFANQSKSNGSLHFKEEEVFVLKAAQAEEDYPDEINLSMEDINKNAAKPIAAGKSESELDLGSNPNLIDPLKIQQGKLEEYPSNISLDNTPKADDGASTSAAAAVKDEENWEEEFEKESKPPEVAKTAAPVIGRIIKYHGKGGKGKAVQEKEEVEEDWEKEIELDDTSRQLTPFVHNADQSAIPLPNAASKEIVKAEEEEEDWDAEFSVEVGQVKNAPIFSVPGGGHKQLEERSNSQRSFSSSIVNSNNSNNNNGSASSLLIAEAARKSLTTNNASSRTSLLISPSSTTRISLSQISNGNSPTTTSNPSNPPSAIKETFSPSGASSNLSHLSINDDEVD